MTVTAGVICLLCVATSIALGNMPAHKGCTASYDCVESFDLLMAQLIFCKEFLAMVGQYLGQFQALSCIFHFSPTV